MKRQRKNSSKNEPPPNTFPRPAWDKAAAWHWIAHKRPDEFPQNLSGLMIDTIYF